MILPQYTEKIQIKKETAASGSFQKSLLKSSRLAGTDEIKQFFVILLGFSIADLVHLQMEEEEKYADSCADADSGD